MVHGRAWRGRPGTGGADMSAKKPKQDQDVLDLFQILVDYSDVDADAEAPSILAVKHGDVTGLVALLRKGALSKTGQALLAHVLGRVKIKPLANPKGGSPGSEHYNNPLTMCRMKTEVDALRLRYKGQKFRAPLDDAIADVA